MEKWSNKKDMLSRRFKDLFSRLAKLETSKQRKRSKDKHEMLSVTDDIRNSAAEEMIDLYLKAGIKNDFKLQERNPVATTTTLLYSTRSCLKRQRKYC